MKAKSLFFFLNKWLIKPSLLMLVLILSWAGSLYSQELNCTVIVNDDQVQIPDKGIFRDMERAFSEFLNKQKWTRDAFENNEKINCNLLITISRMPAVGEFEASVQIQAGRPVYNTSYEALLFNFSDRDWNFKYTESQPLNFNDNRFTNNITSLLAFYAYVVIGFDYDSFSKLAGTPYFEKANDIVTNAQMSNRPGWKQFESNGNRNRYALAENLLNAQLTSAREAYYTYHRLGMDPFLEKPDECRERILEALQGIKKVNDTRPNTIIVKTFFDAKKDELVHLFSEGNIQIKRDAYNILSKIDPSNRDKYESIIRN